MTSYFYFIFIFCLGPHFDIISRVFVLGEEGGGGFEEDTTHARTYDSQLVICNKYGVIYSYIHILV